MLKPDVIESVIAEMATKQGHELNALICWKYVHG